MAYFLDDYQITIQRIICLVTPKLKIHLKVGIKRQIQNFAMHSPTLFYKHRKSDVGLLTQIVIIHLFKYRSKLVILVQGRVI